jgi:NAD(P)-dependent dehydrogenase (short-subunit alcohol dehydrogenase family)
MTSKAPKSADEFLAGLKDQRVAVTAGAGGIGFAIAETLANLGARVAICDISDNAITSVCGRFALAIKADVSIESEVESFFKQIGETLGGLDALINNAGIAGPTGAVEDLDAAEWRDCINIGLTGQFLCARSAVPMLKKAGGGSIVSMSSAAGRHGYAFRTPYSAAKFGVIGLTQSLAKELGPHLIRVNAILPGIIEGPRIDRVISDRAGQMGISTGEMTERYLQNISLRRMTSPYDVASMVVFLLSDAGINISGQSLGVDGNVETL